MPYINSTRRKHFEFLEKELKILQDKGDYLNPGDLNYLITKLTHIYLNQWRVTYNTLNEVMGVLASAQAEFYRRKVVPYEDTKIEENGDV